MNAEKIKNLLKHRPLRVMDKSLFSCKVNKTLNERCLQLPEIIQGSKHQGELNFLVDGMETEKRSILHQTF